MPDHPDRYEREIDEILKKIDDLPGRRSPPPRRIPGRFSRRVAAAQRGFALRLARISVSQVMLVSLGLMLLSYFFKRALGGAWVYGLLLGLILFFTAFVLSFRNGSSVAGGEPYYRGRPRSYYRSDQSALFMRLRDWWHRQRRS